MRLMCDGLIKRVSIFVVLIMLWCVPGWAAALKVHFIDVGYGAATLIESPTGERFLIDAGPETAAPVVVDYLKQQGIDVLDGVVITHPHEDHYGGVVAVMQAFAVKALYYNGDQRWQQDVLASRLAAIFNQSEPKVLRRGDWVYYHDARDHMVVVHPTRVGDDINDSALGLLLTYGEVRVFLPADMQPGGQDAALTAFADVVHADVVQFPHHGGILSDRLVEALRHKIWVLSVGDNPWGKPMVEFVDQIKGPLWRTDEQGTVVMMTDGNDISIKAGVDGF